MNIRHLICLMVVVILVLCGCETQVDDIETRLDYTVVSQSKIPKKLLESINKEKKDEFELTYVEDEYLYAVKGYGTKKTSGYSIEVKNLKVEETEVVFETKIIPPNEGETINCEESFPYIVIKIENTDKRIKFK